MQECPRGTMEESTWALDRFRVRRRCAVRVQRSHRRTLNTKSDGALRSAKGSRAARTSTISSTTSCKSRADHVNKGAPRVDFAFRFTCMCRSSDSNLDKNLVTVGEFPMLRLSTSSMSQRSVQRMQQLSASLDLSLDGSGAAAALDGFVTPAPPAPPFDLPS